MQIEAGKYYKTRDGQQVGPAKLDVDSGLFEFDGRWAYCHRSDGTYLGRDKGSALDIVSEWEFGPVRTVMRRDVAEGWHSKVHVGSVKNGCVRIDICDTCSPSELRAAAAVLLELAGALDE